MSSCTTTYLFKHEIHVYLHTHIHMR